MPGVSQGLSKRGLSWVRCKDSNRVVRGIVLGREKKEAVDFHLWMVLFSPRFPVDQPRFLHPLVYLPRLMTEAWDLVLLRGYCWGLVHYRGTIHALTVFLLEAVRTR